jgi:hypothetical protein
MKELLTEIEIEAPAEKVWQVLTTFEKYPEWNPFITRINGELRNGARLAVHMNPPNGREMTFSPTVLEVRENKELRWLGKAGAGMFNGEHKFAIQPVNEKRVRFLQSEKFTGLLVGLMGKKFDADTRQGFEEMNIALKNRAEKS